MIEAELLYLKNLKSWFIQNADIYTTQTKESQSYKSKTKKKPASEKVKRSD